MANTSHRLPAPAGLLIDRSKPLAFSFEGKHYFGFQGDTIASALAANGVWLLSRSFKYHRPRGILTMAGQDANTLVQLPDEPNVRADRHPLSAGLRVMGQNYNGSLEHDRDRLNEKFARLLPVGFYYKAFFRPKGVWQKIWEPYFRKKAGLGKVNFNAHHGYYDKAYLFCDVAVVGGGPAGMAAALEAAQAGAEVILIEENPILGGALCYARFDTEGRRAAELRQELTARVVAEKNIQVLAHAICNGWFADNYLPVIQGKRLYKVRAQELVVASGMIEQPVAFRNNDLPGVMQASAAQRLIKLYGVKPGSQAVVV
ncbi:MAG: FAD-dependent oxidoreductase, partial [Gammaproteobacteria bacterium]